MLEAPVGGKEISLGRGRVACDKPTGGWTLVGTGLALKPPENDQAVGQAVELKVSADHGGCTNGSTVTLVAVGDAPSFDPNSVVVDVDAGTVEAHGKNLRPGRLRVVAHVRAGSRTRVPTQADAA